MDSFNYSGERFADIQILRYRLDGFENLSLKQKQYVYCLAEATLWGRDVTFDQMGRHNLRIRKLLEVVMDGITEEDDKQQVHALEVYLKRVWFSNGIHHHYGGEKFIPSFSPLFLRNVILRIDPCKLPLAPGQDVEGMMDELFPVIFDPKVSPKRTNKADGEDLVATSAVNFYEGVTQKEVEDFYAEKKDPEERQPPSWGLNSKLIKQNGKLREVTWKMDGEYGKAIAQIVHWLEKAREVAENQQQRDVIQLLVRYYISGDLRDFDSYSIKWVESHEGDIDFINGFIEVYDDPLAIKATWEGLVEYKDHVATKRTRTISDNAQWFENHSPIDNRFKKKVVKGVTANVVCAAMLGGGEYPSTAIGINLPNADWIRAQHGSKSVTIGNLTDAYNKAAHGNGFKEEFVIDKETIAMIEKYGDLTDDLHTDLHECLGHGSGQLLPGTDPDALKAYANTIEEARADLFALYYIADDKLVELGLLPDNQAYKAQYYTYLMNGMMTQLTRINPGNNIEEAHMRNRALIARWVTHHEPEAAKLVKVEGKTYLIVNDYQRLRTAFATLLAEVQRIKSEGDYEAAKSLVEQYAVKVEPTLHQEVLERYAKLNLAPYKGFLNPRLIPVFNKEGGVIDFSIDYSETYEQQMRRYSRDYSIL
ncbi:MAG: dihydrofolate reductase [Prevotella sp.]|nr:dihydrofolate reductase [Prevotella sp.]